MYAEQDIAKWSENAQKAELRWRMVSLCFSMLLVLLLTRGLVRSSYVALLMSFACPVNLGTGLYPNFRAESYDAFCRNWGVHAIKNQQRDYWNEEIVESMVKDLKEPWETVCKSVPTQRSTITSLIGDIDDKIESHLGMFEDSGSYCGLL